jgi:uncharacterized protein YggE
MIKKALLISGMVLALSVTAWAQYGGTSGPLPDRPLVTVSGQAEVMVAPDQVVFTLKAENVNLDVGAAKAKTDAEVKKIFALARDYKIETQNIQTDFVRISESYSAYVQGKPRQFLGYSVTQTTTILLTDITRFERLFSDLVKAGISNVGEVTFRASQMRKYMDQARAQAMKAAREKAVALAAEIGQHIGKAFNIAEVGTKVSQAYDEDNESSTSNVSTSSNSIYISSESIGGVGDTQNTIAPGMISIIVRVRVSFELN